MQRSSYVEIGNFIRSDEVATIMNFSLFTECQYVDDAIPVYAAVFYPIFLSLDATALFDLLILERLR